MLPSSGECETFRAGYFYSENRYLPMGNNHTLLFTLTWTDYLQFSTLPVGHQN